MERFIPMQLERLLRDLDSEPESEVSLTSMSHMLSQDLSLMHFYLQLGYSGCLNSCGFSESSEEVLRLLSEYYLLPFNFSPASPDFLCKETRTRSGVKVNFLSSSSSGSPPNSNNLGLRQITTMIRQKLTFQERMTFKELAFSLSSELNYKNEPIKVERGLRRRVYDAINVLRSAQVIEKKGNLICLARSSIKVQELADCLEYKKKNFKQKKREFSRMLKQYFGLQNLINRNTKQPSKQTCLKFPFYIAVTEDSTSNKLSIRYNTSQNSLQIKSVADLRLFGELDILLKLNLHKNKVKEIVNSIPYQNISKC